MNPYFNILIIDDDQDDHDIFRSATKEIKLGQQKISDILKISSAYNGISALNVLKKQQSAPDFIVLDLNMPLMDGFTFLKEINKDPQLRSIPVYVLTTSKEDKHKKECESYSNCAGFFTKPSTKKEVRTVIEQMLLVHS